MKPKEIKLDLCCGNNKPEGFIGVDIIENVDIQYNLNTDSWPFEDSSISEVRAFDAIEHLTYPITTMNEIWRICKPNAHVTILVPSTDARGAFQDPSHVSFWNINSFMYYTIENLSYLKLNWQYGFHGAFSILELKDINTSTSVIHTYTVLKTIKGNKFKEILKQLRNT